MATFSVNGLNSGIDYGAMIEKLIELQRTPIERLESRQGDYKKQISVYGELSSKLAKLQSIAKSLKTRAEFLLKSVSSTDEKVLAGTAGAAAVPGDFEIVVDRLAQGHRIVSSGVSAVTDVVGTGSGNFSFQVGTGDVTTVAVTASTTLSDLRDAINDANGDARATLLFDGSAYRMVLSSVETGQASAISITENATSLGFPVGPVSGGETLQAAQDAMFHIDDFAMTRTTNTVADALEGVTITLKGEGTATLSISNDIAGTRKRVEEFITAYNDVIEFISSKATFDADNRSGGPFTGESAPRQIAGQLREIIGGRIEGLPEELRVLSQIGVKTERNGALSLDGTVFDAKLSDDPGGVADLFADEGGAAVRIWDYVDSVTKSYTGKIALRTKGLQDIVTGIARDIEGLERRVAEAEVSLRNRFAALEALLGGISSQALFLTSLFRTNE